VTRHEFTDTQTQRILERAIEIDARRGVTLRLDQIESIALELGVSPAALEQALLEHADPGSSSIPQPLPPERFFSPSRIATIAMPLLGALIGGAVAAVRIASESRGVHWETLIGLAVIGGISIALISDHSDGRQPIRLQLRLGGLWAGFLAGFSVIYGEVWSDAVGVMGAWWAGSAVVGLIVPWLRRRLSRSPETDPVGPALPTT
jgi:hypothetical protein